MKILFAVHLKHSSFWRLADVKPKILFAVHLKHSSFWHSADKPVKNDLVEAMPQQCMLSLYVCTAISMGRESLLKRKAQYN